VKIIYPDCIATIVAASENPDYPAANMLGNLPKKVWESLSDTSDSFLITTTASGVSGLLIGTTNATAGTVTVKDDTDATTYETFALSGTWGRFFVKFASTYAEVLHITVALTKAAGDSMITVGTCRCGTFIAIADPQYGLKGKREDYSIDHELSGGGLDTVKRDTPRAYNLSFIPVVAQFDSIDALYNANGKAPLAMLLSDNINLDDQWCGFFHMMDAPDGSYSYLTHVPFSLPVREAV